MFDLEAIDRLSRQEAEIRQVPTPEGPAFVRALDAFERDRWEAWYFETESAKGKFRASLVASCLCDEKGVPFYEEFLDGTEPLAKLPARVIDPIYEVAAELAGVTKADEEKLGNGGASGDESSSASVSPSDSPTPTSCSAA